MDRIHVFLVDEDHHWVEDLKRIFVLDPSIRLVGWAASSQETWNKLQQIGVQPDLFVVHSVIQDGSSMGLIQQLKQKYPQAAFLLQTAQPDATLYPKAMQLGIAQVVVKQSTPSAEMMNIIRKTAEQLKKQQPNAADAWGNAQQTPAWGQSPSNWQTPQAPQQTPQAPQAPAWQQPGQPQAPAWQPPSAPPAAPQQPWQTPQQQPQAPAWQPPSAPPAAPQTPAWQQPGQPQAPAWQPPGAPPAAPQQPWQTPQQVPQAPAWQPPSAPPAAPQQPWQTPQQQPQGPAGWPPQPDGSSFGVNIPQRPSQMPSAPQAPLGAAPRIKQTMIALHSPKGGVGKSTLSKEIASAFSQVRIPNTRPGEDRLSVCLVDLNLDYGDISSMLRVKPVPNISTWGTDVLQRIKKRDEAGDKRSVFYTPQEFMPYLVRHEETGLYVLTAPPRPAQGLFLVENIEIISIILESLKSHFDVVVCDTGNNITDYTITVLEKAHKVLLVTSTDVTCVEKVHALIDTLKQLRIPLEKFGLVINQVPKKRDVAPEQIAQVISIPLYGFITEDPRFRESNNSGKPLVLQNQGESIAQLYKIANQIIPAFGNKKLDSSGKKSWMDWFKRGS